MEPSDPKWFLAYTTKQLCWSGLEAVSQAIAILAILCVVRLPRGHWCVRGANSGRPGNLDKAWVSSTVLSYLLISRSHWQWGTCLGSALLRGALSKCKSCWPKSWLNLATACDSCDSMRQHVTACDRHFMASTATTCATLHQYEELALHSSHLDGSESL